MNKKLHTSFAVLAMGFVTAGVGQAQTARPLDETVAVVMPFDVPYGAPVTLDRADAVLAAAVAESKVRKWKMACAVVDSGANLVSFKRMDDAHLSAIDIAMHKARASAKFRRDTRVFEARLHAGEQYVLTLDDMIGGRGGVLMIEGGKVIGAIGCSGGSGAQDEVVAKAGLAALK